MLLLQHNFKIEDQVIKKRLCNCIISLNLHFFTIIYDFYLKYFKYLYKIKNYLKKNKFIFDKIIIIIYEIKISSSIVHHNNINVKVCLYKLYKFS